MAAAGGSHFINVAYEPRKIIQYARIHVTVNFYRATACNTTHGIATRKPSVWLSVKRVDCDKKKESSAHILTPHERSFILVF